MATPRILIKKRNRWLLVVATATALFYGAGCSFLSISYGPTSAGWFHLSVIKAELVAGWRSHPFRTSPSGW